MFSDPKKNVKEMRLSEGSSVADFGSGSGHYVFALREVVGESGKVFAVDIQKDLLTKTKNEALKLGYTNVEVVWGDLEKEHGSKLHAGILDGLVISNLLFQVEKKDLLIQEASRVLKSGGVLLVIDWTDSFAGIGPSKERVVSKEFISDLCEKNSFMYQKDIDAGVHHYGIVFKKV